MELSYELNDKNENLKDNQQIEDLKNNTVNNDLTKKEIFRSSREGKTFREKKEEENEEEEEKEQNEEDSEYIEDEETKKIRKRQEYKNYLIRLLTEPKENKKNKKDIKLKPINKQNQSKISLDRSLSYNTQETKENVSPYKTFFSPYIIRRNKFCSQKKNKSKKKKEKEKEKKLNKLILKEINSRNKKKKEIFRTNLDKLYGYNKKFLFNKIKLKKEKNKDLEKYQDDILKVSAMNLSKDYMLKLSSDLKTIKMTTEKIKPLPPINFRALVNHSLDEKKRKKRFGLWTFDKKINEMDEYEKEMYMIKTSMKHEAFNSNRQKLLYKMYEILPEHVVDTLFVKKKQYN